MHSIYLNIVLKNWLQSLIWKPNPKNIFSQFANVQDESSFCFDNFDAHCFSSCWFAWLFFDHSVDWWWRHQILRPAYTNNTKLLRFWRYDFDAKKQQPIFLLRIRSRVWHQPTARSEHHNTLWNRKRKVSDFLILRAIFIDL